MRTASFILTFLLGILLLYMVSQASRSASLNLRQTHVESRYQKDSLKETGIASPALAVLGDYRGFDLMVLGVLFAVCGWVLYSLLAQDPGILAALAGLGMGGAGFIALLALGSFPLLKGSNFLDHEALAFWLDPPQARLKGALFLSLAVLGLFTGVLLLWFKGSRSREGSHGV